MTYTFVRKHDPRVYSSQNTFIYFPCQHYLFASSSLVKRKLPSSVHRDSLPFQRASNESCKSQRREISREGGQGSSIISLIMFTLHCPGHLYLHPLFFLPVPALGKLAITSYQSSYQCLKWIQQVTPAANTQKLILQLYKRNMVSLNY